MHPVLKRYFNPSILKKFSIGIVFTLLGLSGFLCIEVIGHHQDNYNSQQSLHIRRVASDYSVVMYVYVGIVGWIYRTKIDPCFLTFLSSGLPTSFFISGNDFSLTCSWSFFFSFMVLAFILLCVCRDR